MDQDAGWRISITNDNISNIISCSMLNSPITIRFSFTFFHFVFELDLDAWCGYFLDVDSGNEALPLDRARCMDPYPRFGRNIRICSNQRISLKILLSVSYMTNWNTIVLKFCSNKPGNSILQVKSDSKRKIKQLLSQSSSGTG